MDGTWCHVGFVRGRRYEAHVQAAPLLARLVLPEEGVRWLWSDAPVRNAWLAALKSDLEAAGPVGEDDGANAQASPAAEAAGTPQREATDCPTRGSTTCGARSGLLRSVPALSDAGRAPVRRKAVDITALAQEIIGDLQAANPSRRVQVSIAPGLATRADPDLLRSVLQNLLDNAWKYTARRPDARVEVGAMHAGGERVYFVRDNGAGFEMAYGAKLFVPFQRLHRAEDYPGMGVGLAMVQRILERHGGRIWAEGHVGQGAEFRFTLPDDPRTRPGATPCGRNDEVRGMRYDVREPDGAATAWPFAVWDNELHRYVSCAGRVMRFRSLAKAQRYADGQNRAWEQAQGDSILRRSS